MTRIRAPLDALASGERLLDEAAGHYLARVLRVRAGDRFVGFDPRAGVEADVEVVSVDRARVRVRIGAPRAARTAVRELTWIQGLAKGEKCDAILRDATELGVTRIVFARTERSVVALEGARAASRRARWEKIAKEASRQSGRADAPTVGDVRGWLDALSDVDARAARYCLDPHASVALASALRPAIERRTPLAFAAGPEGGLTAEEVDLARSHGWTPVSIGPFVLRTETVAAAVLGALRVWTE
jgi:16S rRNA (uracil1498-N3)-methyltransferase